MTTFAPALVRSIPDGYTVDDIRILKASATVEPVTALDPEQQLAISAFQQASPEPIGPDGKPTVMRVMCWMVHEGVNDNRQYFVKAELEEVAKDLFKAPSFGVMDWNHAAARPFTEDPKVIGLWYKADFAFDEKAGKWGILATGMMWSWLFPDHADILLAEQARKGVMSFSMAALPSSIETRRDANGNAIQVLHNPVFFTVSALDVPPADPDSTGVGTEDPEVDSVQLHQRLLAAALSHPWKAAEIQHASQSKQGEHHMEDTTNSELIQKLTEDRVKAEQALAQLSLAHASETEVLTASVNELTTKLQDATTKVSELETVREGLVKDIEQAAARIAELEAEVAALVVIKNEVEAQKAEEARKTVIASRIADLPENIRLIHASKDEDTRNRIEDKWAGMEDSVWTAYLKDELLGYSPSLHVSFLDRSLAAGRLPNIAIDADADDDISARVKKVLR